MKTKLLFILLTFSYFTIFSQTTYVPDDNFEQALIDLGYDDVLDDYVPTSTLAKITELDLSNLGIINLTGIEDFSKLNNLDLSDNQLETIELSNNILLTSLTITNNDLTELNVSELKELESLTVAFNGFETIDISNLKKLKTLNFLKHLAGECFDLRS